MMTAFIAAAPGFERAVLPIPQAIRALAPDSCHGRPRASEASSLRLVIGASGRLLERCMGCGEIRPSDWWRGQSTRQDDALSDIRTGLMSGRSIRLSIGGLAVVCVLLFRGTPAHAQESERAEELIRQANDLRRQGQDSA